MTPPRATFGAVETRLFPNSQAQSSIPEKMRFWRGLSAITAAALVVVATLLAVNLQNNDDAIRDTQLVAQLTGTDTVLRVMASYNPGEQTVRVNRTGGVPRDGRSLQLWLIAGDNPPVSLGLLPDASSGELTVPETALERLASDAVLAISDEPFGGSPTGQPTGAVLVTGSLTEI
ncbi:MAG: anti-sigma factor [Pseudomonadota bacterium]